MHTTQLSDWHVGVDIIEHSRFKMFSRDQYPSFYNKVYTDQEIEYCESKANPVSHFAGIFAAKEASFKAMSPFEDVFTTDFEINHTTNGRPVVNYISDIKLTQHDARYIIRVSISHSRSNAIAYAMCQKIVSHEVI